MKSFLFYLKLYFIVFVMVTFACKAKDTVAESAQSNLAQNGQGKGSTAELTKGKMRIWEGTLPCSDCSGKYTRIMLASNGKTATIASKELGKDQTAQVAEVLVSVSNIQIEGLVGELLSFTLNGKTAFIPYLFLQNGNSSGIYLLNDKQKLYKDPSDKLDANYVLFEKEQ